MWMYVIDAGVFVAVAVAHIMRVGVLVEVRTETETEVATDALIDGNPADGLSISLRSL